MSNYENDDAWWDDDSPFVDTNDWREKKERERETRRARRGCLWSIAIMILLLAAAFMVFSWWEMTPPVDDQTEPEATDKPVSEETTMHYITPDWDELMVQAVLDGNEQMGADCVKLGGLSYTYDDLYLLAKIMEVEAGYEWPDMPIIALANVVLNRVASPLFPDTIRGVLYQVGTGGAVQYAPVHTDTWEETEPLERYIRLAQRALEGERAIPKDVIWQALFPQGSVTVMTYYDDYLGSTTYFCKG